MMDVHVVYISLDRYDDKYDHKIKVSDLEILHQSFMFIVKVF